MLIHDFQRLYIGLKRTTPGAKDIQGTLYVAPTQFQRGEIMKLQDQWSQHAKAFTADDCLALGLVEKVMMGKIMYDGRLDESCSGTPPLWLHVKARGEYGAIKWLKNCLLLQGLAFVKRFWSSDQAERHAAYQSLFVAGQKRTAKMMALEDRAIHPMIATGFPTKFTTNRFGYETIRPPLVPQERDIGDEAHAYYISLYHYRRGPFPAEMSWEKRWDLRKRDAIQYMMGGSAHVIATPRGKWMKPRYRNREKPVVLYDAPLPVYR